MDNEKWILIDDGGGGGVVEMNILKNSLLEQPEHEVELLDGEKVVENSFTHTDPCYYLSVKTKRQTALTVADLRQGWYLPLLLLQYQTYFPRKSALTHATGRTFQTRQNSSEAFLSKPFKSHVFEATEHGQDKTNCLEVSNPKSPQYGQ